MDHVARARQSCDERRARIEIDLVDDDGGGDLVGLGHDEQAIDKLGDGGGIDRGGDDEDLIHVRRDRTAAAAFGDPALEQRRAGLDPDDRVEERVRIVLEPHPVAHDHAGGVALRLAGEHRANLPVGRGDAVHRPVALEHGAEERRHHSDGARAIASSSAVFTSYRDSALSRSAASASVRPQASVSLST